MSKPEVTLEPSKAVVTQAAAAIYAAYISAGCVKKNEEAEDWMKRSMREAVHIARTIDVSLKGVEQGAAKSREAASAADDDDEVPLE